MSLRRTLDTRLAPQGFTVLELLFALVLSGLVLSIGSVLLSGAQRVWRDVMEITEQGEIRRTVATVLVEELGRGVLGQDWWVHGETMLQLRAFRGEARGCGMLPGEGMILVLRRGERQAEAGRDSILFLERTGEWRAGGLSHVRAGTPAGFIPPLACTPSHGERLEQWTVHLPGLPDFWSAADGSQSEPFFFRYFERGQYSMEDRAFRYRRGTAGRQPLTPERISPMSVWELEDDGLQVKLALLPVGAALPQAQWEWRVIGGRGAFPMTDPTREAP